MNSAARKTAIDRERRVERVTELVEVRIGADPLVGGQAVGRDSRARDTEVDRHALEVREGVRVDDRLDLRPRLNRRTRLPDPVALRLRPRVWGAGVRLDRSPLLD